MRGGTNRIDRERCGSLRSPSSCVAVIGWLVAQLMVAERIG
jgi:hypothetical protein